MGSLGLLQADNFSGEETAPASIPAGIAVILIYTLSDVSCSYQLKVRSNITSLQADIRRGGEAELWVGAHHGHHGRDCVRACHQDHYCQVLIAGVVQLF